MKHRIFGALKISILAVWILLLYQLYQRHTIPSLSAQTVTDLAPAIPEPSREYWMGVYYKGKKIGYSSTVWSAEKEGVRVRERAFLSPKILGERKEIKTATQALLTDEYVLKEVTFTLESGPAEFHLSAVADEKALHVTLHGPDGDTRRDIPLSEPPRLPLTVRTLIGKKHVRIGDRYKISVFDPSIVGQTDLVFEIVGLENIESEGSTVQAYKVHELIGSVEAWSWITETGETLKEESPAGFTLIRESRETALSRNWPQNDDVDLIASTAIPVDTRIKDPKSLRSIRLNVTSPHVKLLQGLSSRQKVDGNRITITKEPNIASLTATIPIKDAEGKPYLRPELLIPSDDQEIRLVAQGALGREKAGNRAARRLMDFVNLHLEKVPLITVPNAKQVLKLRKGDCNEHAVLFAALARSVGIPTKVAVGIVYSQGSFYYHAWNEVLLKDSEGRRSWITVDSIFNQIPADVTHVKMAEGGLENQIQIMSFIGNLRIDILDMKS